MELDARSHLDLLASTDTQHVPDRGQSPASALFRRRDEELFGRIAPASRPARARVRQAAGKSAARQLRHSDPDLVPMRASAPPAVKETLLVDPDTWGVRAVEAALRAVADVEVCTSFRNARARLLHQPPDLLITNLRLEAYNGLHLVHLAAASRTRCIVFSTHNDLGLARDVQAAGAFFELPDRLPQVLESYVNATLPLRDRRDVTMLGRRPFRGGRRCTDR
jgi:CheY-like chemotaxis protein